MFRLSVVLVLTLLHSALSKTTMCKPVCLISCAGFILLGRSSVSLVPLLPTASGIHADSDLLLQRTLLEATGIGRTTTRTLTSRMWSSLPLRRFV